MFGVRVCCGSFDGFNSASSANISPQTADAIQALGRVQRGRRGTVDICIALQPFRGEFEYPREDQNYHETDAQYDQQCLEHPVGRPDVVDHDICHLQQ